MSRYLPEDWVLPALDEGNRPLFTSGRLLLQRCLDCKTVQHPPEDVCRQCTSMHLGHVEAVGRGTIHSFTIVHHPVSPRLRECLPYNVALVRLDDHPQVRITGNVIDAAPEQLEIGRAVRVVFEEIVDETSGETYRLPQWQLV